MFLTLLLATIISMTSNAKPNIIVIIADDLGYADLGYQGSEIRTPNIDSLAIGGARLNRCYSHCVCTPSRSALMSGIHPYKTSTQGIVWPWNTHGLPTNLETLGTVFKKQNYQTWAFGKWNLGHATPDYLPLQRGFDHHIGNYTGCIEPIAHTYYGVHDFHEDGHPIYPKGYVADIITNSFIARIKSSPGPFFAYLSYTTPHAPYGSPSQYRIPYNYESQIPYRADYAAMVTHMDDNIGKIIQTLRDHNLENNTYIWFISDNGGATALAANNKPLRGGKVTPYEGGVRVVSFIKGPGIPPKTVVDQPIHVVDVLPTLCHLISTPVPPDIDGQNMYDFIIDNNKHVNRTFILSVWGSREMPAGSLIQGKYKLILGCGGQGQAGATLNGVEIYDLDNDPYETKNIQDPTIRSQLTQTLLECYNNYKPDSYPLFWDPNGPPPGYTFPRYWGEPTVKMLQVNKLQPEPPANLPFHMRLGYPKDLKNHKKPLAD